VAKKKRRAGEHDETRRRLEQAMAALESYRGVSPELDALYERGKKLLAEVVAADDAVDKAQKAYKTATKQLDANVKDTVEKFGRRNLEAALQHFVQQGDTEHAEMLADMLERAKKLSKKDSKKKKKTDEPEE
jgi:hypothetical protein